MTATQEPTQQAEIGRDRRRKEDQRLITGRTRWTDNITLPGMLHLAMVRSPYAHARIVSIDTSAAKASSSWAGTRDTASSLPADGGSRKRLSPQVGDSGSGSTSSATPLPATRVSTAISTDTSTTISRGFFDARTWSSSAERRISPSRPVGA